jgi:anaerobic selenocysteine-containing dehydrogenase
MELCGWGRYFATSYTFGVGSVGLRTGQAMPDLAHTGCLILWGYNPNHTRLSHATLILEALKRGTKLIVVDPRRAGFANRADVWLRVRPGSDGALALGIANVMIQRGWYDRDFLRAWSNGPLLVRADNGRYLTERDVSPEGSSNRLFAWDTGANRLTAYDPATGQYEAAAAGIALEGEYRAPTPSGDTLCRPAFQLYTDLCHCYSPDTVAALTWVGAAQIEETARLLWHARPVSYYAYSGHEQHANVTQTARAMSLLYALTGSFDAEGGNVMFPTVSAASIIGEDLPNTKHLAPVVGVETRPLGPARFGVVTIHDLYNAILDKEPYAIRGLMGFGANSLVAQIDPIRGRQALAALEFHAHTDLFMNPTAEMADIVLPAASSFECDALQLGFEPSPDGSTRVQWRLTVLPPPGEARSDTRIVFDLAVRLGLGEHFWQGDIDAGYRAELAPSGITLEALKATPGGVTVPILTRYAKHAEPDAGGIARGFPTPTRKVELYSQLLLEHGYNPLPDFEEPRVSLDSRPDLATRYPLILTGAKNTLYCDSQHRGLPSLRRRARDPELELHSDAARSRGIAAGDWVAIESPSGGMRARARFNNSLDPRVICAPHGWWEPCSELGAPGYDPFSADGSNYNLLIGADVLDPISGTPSNRAWLCEVHRVT